MKVREWFKNRLEEFKIFDPNSSEGLKFRAKKLIKQGYAVDSPYVTVLVKQALLKEHRDTEIPKPNKWELMSLEEKEEWVLSQLDLKKGKIK